MTGTVGDALRAATRRLGAAGFAASEAEEVLSRLLGVGRGDLRSRGAHPLPPEAATRFAAQLARREAGEPVQYITGRATFRHIDLVVDRRVLVPRPETEWLVEAVLEHPGRGDWSGRGRRRLGPGTRPRRPALAIASGRPPRPPPPPPPEQETAPGATAHGRPLPP